LGPTFKKLRYLEEGGREWGGSEEGRERRRGGEKKDN
jgi:hypothetical protein